MTAMIINIDRKNRTINLSIKAKDMAEESEAMQKIAADKQRRVPAPPIWARCSRPSWIPPTLNNKGAP